MLRGTEEPGWSENGALGLQEKSHLIYYCCQFCCYRDFFNGGNIGVYDYRILFVIAIRMNVFLMIIRIHTSIGIRISISISMGSSIRIRSSSSIRGIAVGLV